MIGMPGESMLRTYSRHKYLISKRETYARQGSWPDDAPTPEGVILSTSGKECICDVCKAQREEWKGRSW